MTENNTELNFVNKIVPSKIDDILSKSCPMAESSSDSISSIWTALHQTINSRLAQDLKRKYNNLNIQTEVPNTNGKSRYDIKIETGYQNKLTINNRNLVIIDTKTGAAKLYQSAAYAIQNDCPAIVAEFLSGDVHVIHPFVAQQILESANRELERIEQLKNDQVKISGSDCRFCSKTECNNRFSPYTPYKVPITEFSIRGLKLEKNYASVKDKIFNFIDGIIAEQQIPIN